MEAKLDPARFVRIHRSTIVKIDRIRDLQAAKRVATLTMRDGTRLKVSDAFREALRDRLRSSGE
jgi:two-component system LytT family response regulator